MYPPGCTPLSFIERIPRLEWIELGERVARVMGQRQEFLTKTHRHWWAPCDACGEGMWLATNRLGLSCRMTAGCEGRHRKPPLNPEEQK